MREGGSGSGGREGRLRKGTSETELGMDGARERGEGGCTGARERYREERGRKGDREGGKLQGMYPDEDTGQYTVYIAQKLPTKRPLSLRLWYFKYKILIRYGI